MLNTDVLIIGSGAAGMSCALSLPSDLSIIMLAKDKMQESSTRYAQGGIAAVIDKSDSYESHIKDTLKAGAGICDENIVKFVVENAKDSINWLVANGVKFTKYANLDKFHLTQEGGHTHRRVLHAADATGLEVQVSLTNQVKAASNIEVKEDNLVVDLWVIDQVCHGAFVLDLKTNEVYCIKAKKVLLASGGASRVYKYSTNPEVSSGDGIAMAYRAGAKISHMEFNQFHPTCLYYKNKDAKSFLLTEALRGEGAKLVLPSGERFMHLYHKQQELAPRDVVARAIDHQMKSHKLECVYLDISHKDENFIKEHFPNIYKKCLEFDFDLTKDLVPVVPAAHYTCGGVCVDKDSKTNIINLYAAGEVSYTGLHGANRMASNSLLECIVYAAAAAKSIKKSISDTQNLLYSPMYFIDFYKSIRFSLFAIHPRFPRRSLAMTVLGIFLCKVSHKVKSINKPYTNNISNKSSSLIHKYWREIKDIMWAKVGIVRSQSDLKLALNRLLAIDKDIQNIFKNNMLTKDLYELRNLSQVAILIVRSAISREVSVGLHYMAESL